MIHVISSQVYYYVLRGAICAACMHGINVYGSFTQKETKKGKSKKKKDLKKMDRISQVLTGLIIWTM